MSNAEINKAKAVKQKSKHEKTFNDAQSELEKVTADAEKVDDEIREQTRNTAGFRKEAEEAQEVCFRDEYP
jgi:structural maintenance of chromosome 4